MGWTLLNDILRVLRFDQGPAACQLSHKSDVYGNGLEARHQLLNLRGRKESLSILMATGVDTDVEEESSLTTNTHYTHTHTEKYVQINCVSSFSILYKSSDNSSSDYHLHSPFVICSF